MCFASFNTPQLLWEGGGIVLTGRMMKLRLGMCLRSCGPASFTPSHQIAVAQAIAPFPWLE